MKNILAVSAILAVFTAGAGFAEDACFGRTYDSAHLAKNPLQQVRDIRARQYDVPAEEMASWAHNYEIRVIFRDDPREFTASTSCYLNDGKGCVIDCDGGVVTPELMPDGRLKLTTDYLRAETTEGSGGESGCAGPVTRGIEDLTADGGSQRTVFMLYPRDPSECRRQ